MMRRIFRDTLGKWHVQELDELKKVWVNSESESTPAKNLKAVHPALGVGLYGGKLRLRGQSNLENTADPALMKKIKQSFDSMHDARTAGSERGAAHHLGVIHGLIHGSKEGDVHLGDLSDMQHESEKNRLNHGLPENSPRFGNKDLGNAIDQHIGDDVKNLHDFHGKFGEGAVKGIARAHGTNVDPYMGNHAFGSHNNLSKKPELVGDTQAFVNGVYGKHTTRDTLGEDGMMYEGYSSGNPDIFKKHADKIDTLYPDHINHITESYPEEPNEDYSEEDIRNHYASQSKDFEDAIGERGMDLFKATHKIA